MISLMYSILLNRNMPIGRSATAERRFTSVNLLRYFLRNGEGFSLVAQTRSQNLKKQPMNLRKICRKFVSRLGKVLQQKCYEL